MVDVNCRDETCLSVQLVVKEETSRWGRLNLEGWKDEEFQCWKIYNSLINAATKRRRDKTTRVENNYKSLQGPRNVMMPHPLCHQKTPWIPGEPASRQIEMELISFIIKLKKTELSSNKSEAFAPGSSLTSPSVFNVYAKARKATIFIDGLASEDWSCICFRKRKNITYSIMM